MDQHAPEIPIQSVTLKQRRQLMQRANDALLSYDPVIKKAWLILPMKIKPSSSRPVKAICP
ncbi:MAG: hypothetical protein ACLSA6_14365 [Holdemania massiliensis]